MVLLSGLLLKLRYNTQKELADKESKQLKDAMNNLGFDDEWKRSKKRK